MNVRTWLRKAKARVPSLDAELILAECLGGVDRSYLVLRADDELEGSVLARAEEMLARRAEGCPLAYLLGKREFYGRDFVVDSRVLIPRPESEDLVRLALELTPRPRRILEVGTGSGCLAISLAEELSVGDSPGEHDAWAAAGDSLEELGVLVDAVDLSEEALELARLNAGNLLRRGRVRFFRSDLLASVESPRDYDLVVANLPYVDENWEWLEKKSLGYEPAAALWAADGGLELIKKLLRQMKERRMRCRVILEADPSQHEAIRSYAEGLGFKEIRRLGLGIMLENID